MQSTCQQYFMVLLTSCSYHVLFINTGLLTMIFLRVFVHRLWKIHNKKYEGGLDFYIKQFGRNIFEIFT
jgi:hypothetical protein